MRGRLDRPPAAPATRRGGRRSSSGSDRGAAAIELAIILPIMLVMIFGVIDFGRLISAQATLSDAAREGARALAFNQDATLRAQKVTGTTGTTVTASVPCPTSGSTAASTATVTVSQTFTYLTPILTLLGGSGTTKTITATGVMPCLG
ncbi:TadE/TadG family type IV pilus assembly protein [Cryptosporangium phraense]|uniref:Pilus assembly protein n=1 Tax=Cryptosporangium phraense TaxID=2593070 RepID=A0A545AJ70_9ACTN|nr:TadE/TadG family type IV pilus assembly protein [Cryptosporangium phraense]TQS40725.1 pilus assembly protein [Cryptosporangium phraense]